MKKLSPLLAVLLSALLLSACNGNAGTQPPDDGSPASYFITKDDGNYYLHFSDGNEPPEGYSCQRADIEFATLAEMQDAFLNNKLSESQINVMKDAFPRDSENRILICDMNHLYQPILPSDLVQNGVILSGESYSFPLINPNVDPASIESLNMPHGNFHYLTKDLYDRDFEYEYEKLFERDTIHLKSTTAGEDRNSTVYDYTTNAGDLRQVRYVLTDGTKTLYIDEMYVLNMMTDALPTSDTIPHRIDVYGIDNGKYFSITLFGFTERPSVEWLSSFGLTEYVSAQ